MKDFTAAMFISGLIGVACIIGMVCALFSHWLTQMFYRIGATEAPAAWLAYIVTLCLLVFVLCAGFGRVQQGHFFWQERE